jgi:hypothetical protein
MWAIIAAVLFAITFVIHGGAFQVSTDWLAWQSFALAGLTCLAIHGFHQVPLPLRRRSDG